MADATQEPNVEQLEASFRERYPLTASLDLRLPVRGARVQSNSQQLIDDLRDYWKDFALPAGETVEDPFVIQAFQGHAPTFETEFTVPSLERGKKRLKEIFLERPDGRIVKKVRTGMVLAFGQGRNLAMGPCLDNENQVVNFVNNRMIHGLMDRGALLAHAAAVELDGSAVAVAGFSGMGKSTLSLHMMSGGPLAFVSNDRLLMKRVEGLKGVQVFGVPKHPRINPGTALANEDLGNTLTDAEKEEFSRLAPEELWELEHKLDAMIDECYGPDRFHLESEMVGFVVLNWRRDGGDLQVNRVTAAERPDLLPAIMKSPGLFFEPNQPIPQPVQEAYLECLGDLPILEMAGGVDFEAARNAAYELLVKAQGDGGEG